MADFYAVTDFENLRFATVDEAVKNYLDEVDPPDRWRTLHVKAYRRMRPKITKRDAIDLIAYRRENWDEELGGPDDDSFVSGYDDAAIEEMVPLVMEFLNQLADRYRAWGCEKIPEENVEVDLEQWLREHDYAPSTVRAT